jgi:hypothetical protein
MYLAKIVAVPIRISAPPLGSQTPRPDRPVSPKNYVAVRKLLGSAPKPLGISRWPLGFPAERIGALPEALGASASPVYLSAGLGGIIPERIGGSPDFIDPSCSATIRTAG